MVKILMYVGNYNCVRFTVGSDHYLGVLGYFVAQQERIFEYFLSNSFESEN